MLLNLYVNNDKSQILMYLDFIYSFQGRPREKLTLFKA